MEVMSKSPPAVRVHTLTEWMEFPGSDPGPLQTIYNVLEADTESLLIREQVGKFAPVSFLSLTTFFPFPYLLTFFFSFLSASGNPSWPVTLFTCHVRPAAFHCPQIEMGAGWSLKEETAPSSVWKQHNSVDPRRQSPVFSENMLLCHIRCVHVRYMPAGPGKCFDERLRHGLSSVRSHYGVGWITSLNEEKCSVRRDPVFTFLHSTAHNVFPAQAMEV